MYDVCVVWYLMVVVVPDACSGQSLVVMCMVSCTSAAIYLTRTHTPEHSKQQQGGEGRRVERVGECCSYTAIPVCSSMQVDV